VRNLFKGMGFLMILFQNIVWSGAQQPMTTHTPPRAAFFYGYPSLVNGAKGDVELAAKVFASYDIIVLGDGVEFPNMIEKRRPIGVGRVEYDRSKQIIASVLKQKPQAEIFGYVPLGDSQALSVASIQHRVALWKEMGVSGIFLDEAGYDWPLVTRARQNTIIRFVHSLGMSAFLNAYQPETLTSMADWSVKNPSREASALTSRDLILLESFPIKNGLNVEPSELRSRLEQALRVRKEFSSRIVALSTMPAGGGFRDEQFEYACWSAWMFGLDGVGWGEPNYSSDNQLPERRCAFLDLSAEQLQASTGVFTSEDRFWRKTADGIVVLDIRNSTVALRHGQYELERYGIAHGYELGRPDAFVR
jgi:hypothetical protein